MVEQVGCVQILSSRDYNWNQLAVIFETTVQKGAEKPDLRPL